MLILLKDKGRNEKGQVAKLLIDLNRFTCQSEFVMKLITGTNLRKTFECKNPRNPQKLQGYVNQTCRKVLRSFIHCRTQLILFYPAFIHLFFKQEHFSLNTMPLLSQSPIFPCFCFALLNNPNLLLTEDKLFSALTIP